MASNEGRSSRRADRLTGRWALRHRTLRVCLAAAYSDQQGYSNNCDCNPRHGELRFESVGHAVSFPKSERPDNPVLPAASRAQYIAVLLPVFDVRQDV